MSHDKNHRLQTVSAQDSHRIIKAALTVQNEMSCSPFEDVEFPRPDGPGGDTLPGVDNAPELIGSPVVCLHGKLR